MRKKPTKLFERIAKKIKYESRFENDYETALYKSVNRFHSVYIPPIHNKEYKLRTLATHYLVI